MAISLTSSNDILFKKYITSQSTTDNRRAYFEEPYPSQPNVFPNSIWLQADQIPTTAATVTGITEFVSLTMSYVQGSNGSFYSPNLVDLIPFNYGPGYNFGVFRNNGTTSIVLGESDWLIDPNAGVITFFSGALNGTVTSTVTTGQVIASTASPPVVRAWKYIGKKGVIPNLSGLTYSGGTMSVLLGQGLTFSNGQVITTLSTLGAGVGLTFSSPTFSVQLSQSSGLTVSQSGLGVNIGTGLTVSNGQLGTLITTSAGLGLTSSGNTFSIQVSQDSGLTLSQSGLSVVDSLKIGSTAVTINGNVIGRYSQDPIGNPSWGPLSIPTKSYVDSIAAGLDLKESVRVAATGSISLTQSPAQVDGITLSVGDRLLLWRQDNTSNGTSSNGIYVFDGPGLGLTRSSDFDGNPNSEVKTGAYVFVTDGITYQGSGFVLVSSGTSSGNILVGTEPQKWTRFNSTTNYQWGRGIDISGDTINIQLGLNSGLSFSQTEDDGGLKIEAIPNSGLTIGQSGLGISSTISGMGLTFNG